MNKTTSNRQKKILLVSLNLDAGETQRQVINIANGLNEMLVSRLTRKTLQGNT